MANFEPIFISVLAAAKLLLDSSDLPPPGFYPFTSSFMSMEAAQRVVKSFHFGDRHSLSSDPVTYPT